MQSTMAMAAQALQSSLPQCLSSSGRPLAFATKSACCSSLRLPLKCLRHTGLSSFSNSHELTAKLGSVQGSKREAGSLMCRASGVLTPELKDALDKFIGSHKVVLFMKGNRNFPQCGFSNTCVQILNQCNVPYETVNILEDESLRQGVKEYSNWPTYPQLYVDGEFYGGCDITLEAFGTGELKETLDKVMLS